MAEEDGGQNIPAEPIEVGDDGGSSGEYYEDDQDEDGDSEDETGSDSSGHNSPQISTRSLSGSILDYPIENGRTYCGLGEGAYFMPNDEAEQTRLSIVHQIHLALLDGELAKAPIKDDIGRILDVGTGTGEWAIAMAEKYPSAEVIGTDLSAMQPDKVPENVFFEIDDAEQEWTYTQGFDLIHMRNLAGSFESWSKVYEQAFKHLNPGGYLEVRDFQMTQWAVEMPDSPAAMFTKALKSASDKAGRPLGVSHIKKAKVRQVGFVDCQVGFMALPLGTWPHDSKQKWMGKMWLIGVLEGLEAMAMRLLTIQKSWPPEAVRDLCGQVRDQLTSNTNETYTPV
ncbi:hypothetical protein FGG08_001468 [Glutinoglossum americanum]|uniref:Methyltransferase n=1 Tax=Glutinoglossum americanum TaxID=1670608 RepID=A0A9P8I238_9PEZI|nr:hypothetical protein FGG08_001468 [Glutinoglossum americanum]